MGIYGPSEEQLQALKESSEKIAMQKILSSKLKSLNNHVANLLQKKIRIDLEIKRTKKKLTKLKNESKTFVKTSISLEQYLEEPGLDYYGQFLTQRAHEESFQNYELSTQESEAELLLKEISELEERNCFYS